MSNIEDLTLIYEPFDHSRTDLFFKLFDFLRLVDGETNQDYIRDIAENKFLFDSVLYTTALSEKIIVKKFFDRVVFQSAFNNKVGKNIVKLLVNWYTAHKIMAVSLKKGIDPFFLSNDDLNLLIRSFGFEHPNKIFSRKLKVSFLYNLIGFYHKKGSPSVFGEVLEYFGLTDIVISEWWLKREYGNYLFKSKPVYPRDARNNARLFRTKEFDKFNKDMHWYLNEPILDEYSNVNKITLPSITPYISISTSFDILRLKTGISILNEWLQECYDYWLVYSLTYVGEIVNTTSSTSTVINEGESYLIINPEVGTFHSYPDRIVTKTNGVLVYSKVPKKNYIVKNNYTSTHWIYNGIDWVDMGTLLPISPYINLKHGDLKRNISLTDFGTGKSLLELMCAVNYLYTKNATIIGSNDTKFICYSGNQKPFDKVKYTSYIGVSGNSGVSGVSGISGYSGYNGTQDNIIDNVNSFSKIYDLYEQTQSNPSSYDDKSSKYSILQSNFEKTIPTSTHLKESFLITCEYPGKFLEVLNPEFKTQIDDSVTSGGVNSVLDTMLVDFQRYLMEISKIVDVPFIFLITGFSIYDTYKYIVDFFKPYRARVCYFTADISIKDKVGDKSIPKSEINYTTNLVFGDQIGRRQLHDATILDSMNITVRSTI